MRRTIVWVLLLALVAGGVATWRYDLVDRLLDRDAGRLPDPVAIAPPPGLDLAPVRSPGKVAAPATAQPLSAQAVRRALAPLLGDPDLGPRVLAAVAPLTGDRLLLEEGDGQAIPASTTKLVTSVAALLALGTERTFDTRVVATGRRGIVLVGGGDPFLASAPASPDEPAYPPRADVVTLAKRTAQALRDQGVRRVRVAYDAGLFSGPSGSPRWEADYVPDEIVSPITALWVDEGRSLDGFGRVADPALTAATTFVAALAAAGIEVGGGPVPGVAPPSAPLLATVSSPPLRLVVERILLVSDNEAAEVLLRHVGLAVVGEASFAAGRRGVTRTLQAAGVDLAETVLYDGSGLSRDNRATPQALVDVLRLAAATPDLAAVLTGLPVAGFTGSLADRFAEGAPEGRGRVRAKTGTLQGVASLAGVTTDLDGRPMLFVLMADRVSPENALDAEVALDAAAAALGACHCGR